MKSDHVGSTFFYYYYKSLFELNCRPMTGTRSQILPEVQFESNTNGIIEDIVNVRMLILPFFERLNLL